MPEQERNPFEGVTDYFSELNRMRHTGVHGREQAPEDQHRTHASAWVPTADIFARGEDLVVQLELAGVSAEDVELNLAHGTLTVSGRRGGEAGASYYVRERFHGVFRRSVTLPEGTKRSQITAEFGDGLVEVVVQGGVRHRDSSRIELRDRSSARTTRSVD
jgi:HSP20 family protein